jgi:hypothetical protein
MERLENRANGWQGKYEIMFSSVDAIRANTSMIRGWYGADRSIFVTQWDDQWYLYVV